MSMVETQDSKSEEVSQTDIRTICETKEDLYKREARWAIARLLTDFCARQKVTVTELLHNADLVGRLENSDMATAHAIQLQATAMSDKVHVPVRELIAKFNILVSDAADRIITDHRKNRFAVVKPEQFGALTASLQGKPEGTYLLNGAITGYLHTTSGWDDKLVYLFRILDATKPSHPGWRMLSSAIDEIIAEILNVQPAVLEVIGRREFFGETVKAELLLLMGRSGEDPYRDASSIRQMISDHFAAGTLPLSRSALGTRIVTDIQSQRKLRENSLEAELKDFRLISDLSRQAIGPHLRRDEVMPALEIRAARFVTQDVINKYLADAIVPEDKIAWFFFLEDCIVGGRSRYRIADTIFRLLNNEVFRSRMRTAQLPAERRLQILVNLSGQAMKSGFDPDQRKRMAGIFDSFACEIAKQLRLFETIEAKPTHPCLKVQAILKLFADKMITQGKLSAQAHAAVLGYLSQSGFLTGYLQLWGKTHDGKVDKKAAILELALSLKGIGLEPDTFLAAMAA